ncbi:uncharacterized protein LOC107044283 isoform X2 [Diachasma alloeum]|uniref:uncharacterized protein LOC107044283 isoform X2 n=1 Tax=Diachasma alloeum TaxID=454923 RepID=UPI0007383F19|nr:uncharacterized protein LOC107044283 isoform X2 [Diachasma alloeum]
MTEDSRNCKECKGCSRPGCYKRALERMEHLVNEAQEKMDNQGPLIEEIKRGEEQIKSAAGRLRVLLETIQDMVDMIEVENSGGAND